MKRRKKILRVKRNTLQAITAFSLIALAISVTTLVASFNYYQTQLNAAQLEITMLNSRVAHLDQVATCQFHEKDVYTFPKLPGNWGESVGLPYLPVGSTIQIEVKILSGNPNGSKMLLFTSGRQYEPNFEFWQKPTFPSGAIVSFPLGDRTGTPFGSRIIYSFTVPYQSNYWLQVNNQGRSALSLEITVSPPPYC